MNARWSRVQARAYSWVRAISRRQRLETEMEAEIRFHIEARAEDLVRQGFTPSKAARQARIDFGTVAAHKAEIRSSLGLRWWDELSDDLRYGFRLLRKSPSFTLLAVGSLAVAIGANTTIFSVANEMLLERLDVPHPEQLRLLTMIGDDKVVVHMNWGETLPASNGGERIENFTYPIYKQLRAGNHVLEDLFAFKDLGRVNATIHGEAESANLELVSGNFYQQMQVQPILGRPILPSDDEAPGTGAVVVISQGLWNRAFSRSTSVIGKVITINMAPVTIVGVNPKGFTGAASVQQSPEFFMPLSMMPRMRAPMFDPTPILETNKLYWLQVMGRARPGVSEQQAQASLDVALGAAVRATTIFEKGDTLPHLDLQDGSKGMNFAAMIYEQPLSALMAMVGAVLLLACANLANLMLARTVYASARPA